MDELENALAWFRSAPSNLWENGKKNTAAVAQWIWEVIQGDFNENQTTAQTVTSTVISMIPFVDQICDVRDLVANCKKINEDTSNKWAWIAIVLTLIGLIPTVGSLLKGCLKIPLNAARRSAFALGKHVKDLDLWKHSAPAVEASLVKLNEFLARPAVRRTLAGMRVDNVYGWLARQVRDLAGQTNVAALLAAFDKLHDALKSLMALVQKWGTAAMNTQAGQLLQMVDRIRRQADDMLRQVLKPVQDFLDKLARRLDHEAHMTNRAVVNAANPHQMARVAEAGEARHLKSPGEPWARTDGVVDLPQLRQMPVFAPNEFPIDRTVASAPRQTTLADFPDLSRRPPPPPGTRSSPLDGKFDTFHQLSPAIVEPGERIYRVLDPFSGDNSICWMREKEFLALKGKTEWRERFAVWASWNKNGEYVVYTVPPGKPLYVWEGPAASQTHAADPQIVLNGGASQLVVDPAQLVQTATSSRMPTGWGYQDISGEQFNLVGVPLLTNRWFGAAPPTAGTATQPKPPSSGGQP